MLFLTLAVFWAALFPPELPTILIGMTLVEPPLPASFFGVGLSADSFVFVVGDEGDFTEEDDGETGDLGVGDLVAAANMCLFSSGGKV